MNNILTTGFNTLYLFAGMVLLEYIVFMIVVAHKNINLIRAFMAVLSGNALTAIMCLFLPAGTSEFGYYTWLGVAFIVSFLFEWAIDVAYFKNRENTLKSRYFMACSLFGNLVSFGGIAVLHYFDVLEYFQ